MVVVDYSCRPEEVLEEIKNAETGGSVGRSFAVFDVDGNRVS
ncbi:MAG: hypothetical protein ACJATT_005968 [Myxococcota bacterium]|jgi:hypothetical protein